MLKEHQRFILSDKAKENDFFVDVNWNPKDEQTNDCKVFKFTFSGNKESFIDKKLIYEMLFACGEPKDQQKMIPQRITTVRNYETVLGIKASGDIRKGEMINVKVSIPLPAIVEDIIADARGQKKSDSGLIVPK